MLLNTDYARHCPEFCACVISLCPCNTAVLEGRCNGFIYFIDKKINLRLVEFK